MIPPPSPFSPAQAGDSGGGFFFIYAHNGKINFMPEPITPIDLSKSAPEIASDIRNRYSAGGRRRAKPKLRSGLDGFRLDIADDAKNIPIIPINADTGQAIVDFDEVRGSNVIWGIVDRSEGFDVVGVSPSNGNGGMGRH